MFVNLKTQGKTHHVTSKSCSRSCFLALSFVQKIVLFRALLRAMLSFVQKSWSWSCFLVLSFVPKVMVFGALPRAKIRTFWCSPACQKSCSRSCFWCSPSF
jgi:hypothetical protein